MVSIRTHQTPKKRKVLQVRPWRTARAQAQTCQACSVRTSQVQAQSFDARCCGVQPRIGIIMEKIISCQRALIPLRMSRSCEQRNQCISYHQKEKLWNCEGASLRTASYIDPTGSCALTIASVFWWFLQRVLPWTAFMHVEICAQPVTYQQLYFQALQATSYQQKNRHCIHLDVAPDFS